MGVADLALVTDRAEDMGLAALLIDGVAHRLAVDSLAIDGKTMCNAIDEQGRQTHIMSVVGHQTNNCYTQSRCPAARGR